MLQQRVLQTCVVKGLHSACTIVDAVAYRPVVIRLTEPLPRWWSCGLTDISMKLDERWQLGFWASAASPPAPQGVCEACGRRAAWLVVGGIDADDEPLEGTYLTEHPVGLCGWCRLRSAPFGSRQELELALGEAKRHSVSWRWR